MRLRFTRSALRHGIDVERASFVVERCPRPHYEMGPSASARVVFLGLDARGVPLEVVAVELGDDEFVVIHAMRMRKRYAAQFREVMRWRDS